MPTPAMPPLNVSLAIFGEAGDGVLRAGEILTFIAARSGLSVLGERMPPSEFQGEICSFRSRISRGGDARSTLQPIELCISMDAGAARFSRDFVKRGCFCILDSDAMEPRSDGDARTIEWARAPIRRLALESSTDARAQAFALAGLACGLLNIQNGENILSELPPFIVRNGPPAASYQKVFFEAFQFAKNNFASRFVKNFDARAGAAPVLLTSVFDEIAAGLIAGGVRRIFGAPGGLVSAFLSAAEREVSQSSAADFVIEAAESPALAAGFALGSSFGGTPTGIVVEAARFPEVAEAVACASVAEIPLVVLVLEGESVIATGFGGVDSGNLMAIAFSGPSQTPRAILSIPDHRHAAPLAMEAICSAEGFQIPAILVTQARGAHVISTRNPENLKGYEKQIRKKPLGIFEWSARYEPSPTGVSPMPTPGDSGFEYVASAGEHDRRGMPSEPGRIREQMQQKRWLKLEILRQKYDTLAAAFNIPSEQEVENFDLVVISTGLTSGVLEETVQLAARESLHVLHLQLHTLMPLPRKLLLRIRDRFDDRSVLVFEEGAQPSLRNYLKMEVGLSAVSVRKGDGNAFRAAEVLQRVREVMARR